MGHKNNIERNKIDYLLTDIMPVEISELFSYGKFYEFLLEHQKELDCIVKELMKLKASGKEYLWRKMGFHSLKIQYFKRRRWCKRNKFNTTYICIKHLFIHRMLSKGNFELFRK